MLSARQQPPSARKMLILLVEDHKSVRQALREGLEATGEAQVIAEAATAREAIAAAETHASVEVALMDVELRDSELGAAAASGVGAAIAIRRERPRFPVVFYSIQDDDSYFREFRAAGILSHYAYVRKSNYLLPSMLIPLLRDAIAGRSFIDPEIEDRVDEVRERDAVSPRALLEPNELRVAELLAQGLTNEQIASRLGLRDARAVSRTNGRIYDAWRLSESATDEKVARARAALIYLYDRPILWDEEGHALAPDRRGGWTPLFDDTPPTSPATGGSDNGEERTS
ncbi:MAG TPA: response regulator [Ktedonobacterales bacterium]|nr:response regulator [Ktedonobacterales bacterium]